MYQNISVTEAAKLKRTSRQTIYANKGKFDWTTDKRIIPNQKFQNWLPLLWGGRIAMVKAIRRGEEEIGI